MVYHLTLIGEAAARLSPGMRDVTRIFPGPVHGYFAIDLEEVWVTVEQRVPVLQNQIETILRGDTGPRTVAERRPAYRLALKFSR
jgi:uncharacterized protein with HEPN domain